MNSGISESSELPTSTPWDPEHSLRQCDAAEVLFSRGFLRSHPERWFPGFSAFWLPLAHSLGIEVQLVEVRPLLIIPASLEYGFGARIDGESLGILFDQASARVISESVAPGSEAEAGQVILEYMMRRFVYAASVCWSAIESSTVEFDRQLDPFRVNWAGAVKLTIMINNNYATIWTALGRELLQRLDGLWRRQIYAQAKADEQSGEVRIEIAQLSVSASMLSDYSMSGTLIDLQVPTSESVTLRLNGRTWLPARLAIARSEYVLESLAGAVSEAENPDGSTIVSVELGRFDVEAQKVSELSQTGAFLESGLAVGNRVSLVASEQVIGRGILCEYEGRFAVLVE